MTDEKFEKLKQEIIKYEIIDLTDDIANELNIDRKSFMICKRTLLFDKIANEEVAINERKKAADQLKYKATLDYLKRKNLICKQKNQEPSSSLICGSKNENLNEKKELTEKNCEKNL